MIDGAITGREGGESTRRNGRIGLSSGDIIQGVDKGLFLPQHGKPIEEYWILIMCVC